MSTIWRVMPERAPRPFGWGRLEHDEAGTELWYFGMEYLDLETPGAVPPPGELAAAIHQLHEGSRSPTGQFGFHVPVCDGSVMLDTRWDARWSTVFARVVAGAQAVARAHDGVDARLEALMARAYAELIPRLLGAVEPHIRPVFVHGDMWEGNLARGWPRGPGRAAASEPRFLVFDSAGFYAHREYDLYMTKIDRHNITDPVFVRAYLELCPPSEPVEEFDDRLLLYSIKGRWVTMACNRDPATRRRMREQLSLLCLFESASCPG